MEKRMLGDIVVLHETRDQETADLIEAVCEQSIHLIRDSWGAEPPKACRIHVMTGWLSFVFQATPWFWRIPLVLTLPLWRFRARKMWGYAAAWTQWYGKNVAIGVKPPRLLEQSDRSIGQRMFVEEKDINVKIQGVTCHELVHASLAHLRLPMWLNEGTALLTVDRFLGRQTIRPDTLCILENQSPKSRSPSYRSLARMRSEEIAYHNLRGYWLTRYLEEVQPGLLQRMFSQGRKGRSVERAIFSALGMQPARFWQDIDGVMAQYFRKKAYS